MMLTALVNERYKRNDPGYPLKTRIIILLFISIRNTDQLSTRPSIGFEHIKVVLKEKT